MSISKIQQQNVYLFVHCFENFPEKLYTIPHLGISKASILAPPIFGASLVSVQVPGNWKSKH